MERRSPGRYAVMRFGLFSGHCPSLCFMDANEDMTVGKASINPEKQENWRIDPVAIENMDFVPIMAENCLKKAISRQNKNYSSKIE